MTALESVAELSSTYVESFLNGIAPSWMVYHTLEHAAETAYACKVLASGSRMDAPGTAALAIAAWFHDAGYMGGAEGHEERSVEIAAEFLRKHQVDRDTVENVLSAIRSTRMPQQPRSLMESILCDADVIHVGREDFFAKSDLLRSEMEQRLGKGYTDEEWYRFNLDFVERHPFHTDFARRLYGEQRLRNLRILKERLAAVA